jgi:hypothetical protein
MAKCQHRNLSNMKDDCPEEAVWGVQFSSDYPEAAYQVFCDAHISDAEDGPNWRETIPLQGNPEL